jgi:hypothetical protein
VESPLSPETTSVASDIDFSKSIGSKDCVDSAHTINSSPHPLLPPSITICTNDPDIDTSSRVSGSSTILVDGSVGSAADAKTPSISIIRSQPTTSEFHTSSKKRERVSACISSQEQQNQDDREKQEAMKHARVLRTSLEGALDVIRSGNAKWLDTPGNRTITKARSIEFSFVNVLDEVVWWKKTEYNRLISASALLLRLIVRQPQSALRDPKAAVTTAHLERDLRLVIARMIRIESTSCTG